MSLKKTATLLVFLGVVVFTIAAGTIHGHITLRWGPRPDMKAAAALLRQMPVQCGDWRMESSQQMSPGAVKMLRCVGYVSRRYVNQRSGQRVDLGIVFGPPGPISEHTPEVCTASREFNQLGRRERIGIECDSRSEDKSAADEFWFVDFQGNDVSPYGLRVYWAWSTGERWLAPQGAKSAFAGSRHLYKIQLSTRWPGSAATMPDAPQDACGEFLKAFLPVAQRYLVVKAAELAERTDVRN